jgi:hypothetical protein
MRHDDSNLAGVSRGAAPVSQAYLATLHGNEWTAKVVRKYADGSQRESEFPPKGTLRMALLDIEAAVSEDTWVDVEYK